MESISKVVCEQKKYFYNGNTRNIEKRKQVLKNLKIEIKKREDDILNALFKDLGKSNFEAYATEIGIVYDEINIMIKNLNKWSKRERVKSSIVHFPSKNYIYKEPYGIALIIGPFNYPFQLTISPLIGAIGAGNCAVIKPSEYSMNTSIIIEEIISKVFEEEYVKVVEPSRGKELVEELLDQAFDYIFFTGSVRVGKIVMEKAAKKLIPLTLELGGKSPCIVDKDANLKLSAKRIVWGKLINAGQTCVAPDYLFVHEEIKGELLKFIVEEIKEQYGECINKNEDYPKIISEREVERLVRYFDGGNIYFGGEYSIKDKYIQPTILTDIREDALVMEEEIFGPIIPVITFKNIKEAIDEVNKREKPLALYYFSENKESIEFILKNTTSGGVTINDTIIHVASSHLPFGGVGTSGMGAYHGKASFDTFTHRKSVLKRGTFMELPIRYAPFKNKISLLKKVMK
ncbi:MAG: aldehyde dehydrogenase [Clostridium sp.]